VVEPQSEPPVDVDDQVEDQVEDQVDVEDDQPLRWYVIAAFMVLVVAGFAVAVVCTAGWYAECDDGRHTSPFTADDSLRGTLCDSGHGAAGLVIPGGWLLGLVLATFALVRWGAGGVRAVVLAALFLAPLALPPAAYAALRSSGTTCTGDKLEAYQEWVDAGGKGTAPYECRTF